MIKAVIFDMYETLITLHAVPTYFGAQIAADAGIAEEKFLKRWRSAEIEHNRTIGKLTLEKTIEIILKENDCYSKPLLQQIVCKRIQTGSEAFRHLHPEIYPMLTALKQNDIAIGLISNCYPEEATLIKQSALYPYFDVPCLSSDEGIKKPNPEIFQRCLKRLQLTAAECLYVGDGGSEELETARKLGMIAVQAVWYLKANTGQIYHPKPDFQKIETPFALLDMV